MANATEAIATLELLVKSNDRVQLGFTASDGTSERSDTMAASEGIAFVKTMEMIAPLKGWESIRYSVYRNENLLGIR
jgi:S-methylmethionine-dependent homocysteine/selenocysteine methylase